MAHRSEDNYAAYWLESPASWQPTVPPNTPELALSETLFSDTPPPTPESTSSTLSSSPMRAALHRPSSSTVACFVDTIEHFPAFSPPSRPGSRRSAFGETRLQLEVFRENRFNRSSTSGTTGRSESASSHWFTCSPTSEASSSPQRPSPDSITSANEADSVVEKSAPTMPLAAPVPNRTFLASTERWNLVFGPSITLNMPPPTSPPLPASTASSTSPASVERHLNDADVATYVEDVPMERPSIPVPLWTFREPVSTNTARLSDKRIRKSSTVSDPGY